MLRCDDSEGAARERCVSQQCCENDSNGAVYGLLYLWSERRGGADACVYPDVQRVPRVRAWKDDQPLGKTREAGGPVENAKEKKK